MKKNLKYLFLSTIIGSFFMLIHLIHITTMAQVESEGWIPPINLSKSGGNSDPILLIDSNGGFHAIWKDTFSNKFIYSKGDENTWNEPQVVKFPFPYYHSLLQMIADHRGRIHAFWTDENNNLLYSRVLADEISLSSQWIPIQLLGSPVLGFDVAVDEGNNLHLAYIRGESPDDTSSGVYYLHYIENSVNWTQATEIDESAYLRTITPDEANIDIAVAENPNNLSSVYIAWNNQPRARLYLAISQDTGSNWGEAAEIIAPELSYSSELPFDIMIEANRNEALILWKLGEGESSCSQRYLWSSDNGITWEDSQVLFGKEAGCPKDDHLFVTGGEEFLLFTMVNGQAYFLAWDGSNWSDPQQQDEFSVFSDPETNRILNLKCLESVLESDIFYIVGCDQDISGDIWFSSRNIGSTEEWFHTLSAWESPQLVTSSSEQITELTSVADEKYYHAIWVQSPGSDTGLNEPSINYSRWDGERWSSPTPIFTELGGVPIHLAAVVDNLGRILLVWINQQSGELLFSWANSERASIPVEWSEPINLPSPSKIISSPDLLVDSEDKIVVVFAVPFNDSRGIYTIESNDYGETWTQPSLAFDAILAGWESVDQPKISLTADGRLHLLLTKFSVEIDQRNPQELFYSQSIDGGSTWSELEEVNDRPTQSSEIIGYDENLVHRLWQESRQSAVVIFDQVSEDSGLTWGRKINLSGSSRPSQISLTSDQFGRLHFTQIIQGDNLTIQNLIWDGSSWNSQEIEQIKIEESSSLSAITTGITAIDYLNVALLINNQDQIDEIQSQISSIGRFVGLPQITQTPVPALNPVQQTATKTPPITPDSESPPEVTDFAEIQPKNTQETNVTNSNSSPLQKNFVGIVLVVILAIVLVSIFGLYRLREIKRK